MQYLRRVSQRTKLVWGIVLCMALLFAQSATLHVHVLEHDHAHHHNHEDVIDTAHEHEHHSHMSSVHFSIDTTHNNHHEKLGSEVEITPEVWFKHASSSVLVIAFLTFVLCLGLLSQAQHVFRPTKASFLANYRFYYCSPPLRAPPRA